MNLYGLYLLTSCTNPAFKGSYLALDYDTLTFSQVKKVGFVKVIKHTHGSIRVNEDQVKIMWLNAGTYDVDTPFLPIISLPYKSRCKRITCTYSVQENWLTIKNGVEKYVFRKNLAPVKRDDTLMKLFCTQLLLDLVIRHIG